MKPLTGRELAVVEMLVQGYAPKEIACKMGIKRTTVSSTLCHVRIKTGYPTMITAILFLVDTGVIRFGLN